MQAQGAPRICAEMLERAAQAERSGEAAAARAHLAEVLERDPACSDAHARLERLTGPARAPEPEGLEAALRLAVAHPYDPRALLAAAQRAAGARRPELALALAEKVVWLGDLAPGATADALRLLAALESAAPLRPVPVHVYADATARAGEGWRFRLRTLWSDASSTLAPLLGARFVALSIEPFEPGAPASDLPSLFRALAAHAAPEHGIVAGVVGPPAPGDGPPDARRGAAEFLGRRLLVRLEPGAAGARVLAHELLHLYGAVHAPEESDSLMSAHGDSRRLDARNRLILELTRERTFGPGGVERDLLPALDHGAAIDAWGAALRLDLALRGPDLAQAVARSALSGGAGPDPHLGDVARWLAALLVAEERRDEAALLLDTASALHGPGTEAGRREAERARALRAQR